MRYPPRTERYACGGKVKYLIYRSPQPMRSGRVQERTRVKRLYFPANARDITVSRPTTQEKRTGRQVHGVEVRYQARLSGAEAHRGTTIYQLPERWVQRSKVVELPRDAKDVHLVDRPPEGPRMAVA